MQNLIKGLLCFISSLKRKRTQTCRARSITYHGVSPKNHLQQLKASNYVSTFGETMIDICNKRDDVVVITPAMTGGSGLTRFSEVHPEKLIDVGIAEEHAVTFAAGLSRSGIKPVLAIYSTFLQRGFDQLIHDVCIQNLPMVLALDRAGFAGEDGATHHGVFDYNYMLPIPNMTILAPKDGKEQSEMFHWAVEQKKIVSIRYPKGSTLDRTIASTPFSDLSSEILLGESKKNYDVCIIGVGSMAWPSYDAGIELEKEGISSAVINLRSIKPLDKKTLTPFIQGSKYIIVVEEGAAIGGVYFHILQSFNELDISLNQWKQIAIPDEFVEHGSIGSLRSQFNLSKEGILRK